MKGLFSQQRDVTCGEPLSVSPNYLEKGRASKVTTFGTSTELFRAARSCWVHVPEQWDCKAAKELRKRQGKHTKTSPNTGSPVMGSDWCIPSQEGNLGGRATWCFRNAWSRESSKLNVGSE